MFGFGLGKLIVLLLVIVAVWYGFKLVGRLERERKRRIRQQSRQGAESVDKMEQCPICETYVVAATARGCGREGCPY